MWEGDWIELQRVFIKEILMLKLCSSGESSQHMFAQLILVFLYLPGRMTDSLPLTALDKTFASDVKSA